MVRSGHEQGSSLVDLARPPGPLAVPLSRPRPGSVCTGLPHLESSRPRLHFLLTRLCTLQLSRECDPQD